MKKKVWCSILCLLVLGQFAEAQESEDLIIGSMQAIHSKVLSEDRTYWIGLPESYSDEAKRHKRYPVLILLDGNIHFKAFAGVVHQMSAGYNGNRQIPEMIVVGLTNVDRERDFTPDKVITRRQNRTGGGDAFLRFLEEELIPELDRNYRTLPYRMLFGHSLGGLLTTHAYMKAETLFNAFIAVDPSLGTWDTDVMDTKVEGVTDEVFTRPMFFATANWGKRNVRNRDRHMRLYEALHSRSGAVFSASLTYFEDENHGSVPLPAFYEGLTAIFEGYGLSYWDVESREAIVEHFQGIAQRLSFEMLPPEELVNRAAYRLLRSRDDKVKRTALDLFLLNVENYPDSYTAFTSLGEAYSILGQQQKAIESFEEVLRLNPDNQRAKELRDALQDGGS